MAKFPSARLHFYEKKAVLIELYTLTKYFSNVNVFSNVFTEYLLANE